MFVRQFGGGTAQGRARDKALLGGKGANLAEMASLGLPVPPGFTITTEVCRHVMEHGVGNYPAELTAEVESALAQVETLTKTKFGDGTAPLLVSVRSGAPASMPGMMDTILNLGLNDVTVAALAKAANNARFAWDCYRRFVAMYGEVVMGVVAPSEEAELPLDVIFEQVKSEHKVHRDQDLSEVALQQIVARSKAKILELTGTAFPDDVKTQLWGAIGAVFRSWGNPRADVYRRMHGISASIGTAVNVQAMVFGNLGDDCATGVAFTRNPATGTAELYGEFLINAQGEDVVAGVRTPSPLPELATKLPAAFAELVRVAKLLERHFRDMQDLEFTIMKGQLFMLQTRNGKRTGKAMVKIAVDLVAEKLLDTKEAVLRIEPGKLDEVLHPTIDPKARPTSIGKGLPASPGAAIGRIVFTANSAEEWASRGETVLLVRTDTSPEDIHGMKAAAGILTARGGMTSHAAVVARGMGKCCVTACTSLRVDIAKKTASFISGGKEMKFKEGDTLTLDGSTGEVFVGTLPLVPAKLGEELGTLMKWVDEHRTLKVRTNADTPNDARTARSFGAEGIGLCRTEHMFFQPERILVVREMIVAADERGRRAALAKLLPMQRSDFAELFRVMDGLPVTIRLLDPPLHEFLPHTDAEIEEVATSLGSQVATIRAKVAELSESNPMLGHRGCRLGITYPEIYEMQVQAIGEAADEVSKAGVVVTPEIMIPLVMVPEELRRLRVLVEKAFTKVTSVPFTVGTMIELPRACVVADRIAEHADFFSFGTNDLTQTTYGLSRDDAGRFLPAYIDGGVIAADPFAVLDPEGVGALIELGVRGGRSVKPGLKVGICGEHGGEPSSVELCHRMGFDYVSCSPFRVPIARVAAARAAILSGLEPLQVAETTRK